MTLYRDHGIVLRTYRLGEADRIVVLFTQAHGKVRAVAKGVRKTRSRFGARLEPPSHDALLLYAGRDLDIVSQAESVDHFRAIRDDLDRWSRASVLLEAVDQITPDRQPDARVYQMLLGALRALAAHNSPVLVAAFFLKLLAHEGLRPQLDVCVACGAGEHLVTFDADQGGVLCEGCRRGVPLSGESLAMIRGILGGELGAALNEPASVVTREVELVATRSLEHHLERRLRSQSLAW